MSTESMELLGSAGVTYRHYRDNPLYVEQENDDNIEVVFKPEVNSEISDRLKFKFKGLVREGNNDGARNHADVRELLLTLNHNSLDISFGIGKVFWGVTESRHLVDVINQVDLIEDVLEEEKLGQPMLNILTVTDVGSLSFYWLPYFRKREFPDLEQRFRYPPVFQLDDPVFLHGRHNKNRDYALRYSNSWDEIDLGISYFNGNGRMPWFVGFDGVVKPVYNREKQLGFDFQYTTDAWLIKHESIYNQNSFEDYLSTVYGFEYTFFQLNDGLFDLGVLFEHLYSNKSRIVDEVFNNDVFAGVRVALNDVQSSSLLFGVIYDPDSSEGIVKFESEKRVGQDWTIAVNALYIFNPKLNFQSFSNDSFIEATILYHF
jgi:hypothetical protein